MTKKEHDTFDKILELVIKQGTTGKELLDQLRLLSRMKATYEGDNQ